MKLCQKQQRAESTQSKNNQKVFFILKIEIRNLITQVNPHLTENKKRVLSNSKRKSNLFLQINQSSSFWESLECNSLWIINNKATKQQKNTSAWSSTSYKSKIN